MNALSDKCAFPLSDSEWGRISDALPKSLAGRAKKKAGNYRIFVEAVLWVACCEAFWPELPSEYGPWRTVYVRYIRWYKMGAWKSVGDSLGEGNAKARALGKLLEHQLYIQNKRELREERGANQ